MAPKPPFPDFDRWPDELLRLWPGQPEPPAGVMQLPEDAARRGRTLAQLLEIIRVAYEFGQDSVTLPRWELPGYSPVVAVRYTFKRLDGTTAEVVEVPAQEHCGNVSCFQPDPAHVGTFMETEFIRADGTIVEDR